MLDPRQALWRTALLSLLVVTLAACGGGGGDDDDEEEIEDEDATGLWSGTFTQAGVARSFIVMAAPSGQFVGVVSGNANAGPRLMVGTGSTLQNIINANGTVFAQFGAFLPNGQPNASFAIAAGRITERVSITGNYSGGGETATVSLSYDTKSARGGSLAAVAGIYSQYPVPTTPGAVNATLTINSAGATTFATSTGCNGTGTFSVIDPALNMYSWTLSVAACQTDAAYSASGLASLTDSPLGGTNNLLQMAGARSAFDRGFAWAGTK